VDGGGETERGRLDVGVSNVGSVGSANLGRRFLARAETADIAASWNWGSMIRREGAGEELTATEGAPVA